MSEQHTDDRLSSEGLTEYKYDLHGNLRFKRDAKSKSDTIMVYYRYDSLDRTIEIGISADKYFTQEKAESEIPDSVLNPQIKYVYDLKSPDVYGQKHLRGRLSYKAYKNHGDWDYTYYSYTRDGKIEWIEHHIQGLRKRIEYEYDLAGNIVKISYYRNGPDQLFYWYEYGPTGSLISVYTNTTDDCATAQKEITYLATDQFGNQTQIILGYNVQAVDTIEYVYDIWNNLLSINDVNDLGNDKFAMKLFYNSNDFEQKYYNGLISGIELHYPAISGVNENRYRYGFEYDPLSRLKNAQHYWPEYESPENPGVISAWIGDEKYKVNNLLYDANGNIKSLRRNNDNGTILNDLQYSYATNTNKLTSVTDGSLTKTFGYDASGNVIKYNAGNDHLYEIEYNFRNLPIQIQTTGPDGEPVFYYYAYGDGAGRIYDKEDNLITAYYIRGLDGQVMAEYNYQKNLKLWRLGSFGFKTPDGISYYYLKDHIGNIRVTVNEQGDIVTKDDYYPFGLRMPGLSYNNGNQNDRLKFQSKRLQDYGNWKTYYFGWRDYDPELGRWFVVDPARQFASPYVYGGNNPVIGFEEDGRWFGIDDLFISGVSFVIGYVSYGLNTGQWGGDAFAAGGIAAVSAWLAYNTGGAAAGFLFSEGSAGFTITSATVGGAVGGATSSVANQLYFTGQIDRDLVGRSAFSGAMGGLAGGFVGQYITADPVLTSMIGGAVGGGIEGSYRGKWIQGAMAGAYFGAWSGALTTAAYENYGEYLTNKYLEENAFGKDISRESITTNDPSEYNCKDFLIDMRTNGLSKDIRAVSFGENQAHVGFDIGGDLYGHRYILSKQGANFPIKVNTARSLSNGSWLKSGFIYKGKYFDINSGRYGQWKYLEF
ncbi:RHS repeat domain-containing protein [Calditrichota bacterium LG25]